MLMVPASSANAAVAPPAAFVTWTMLQRSTSFDAVAPDMASAPRTVVALLPS
jgi:hypothetical protein